MHHIDAFDRPTRSHDALAPPVSANAGRLALVLHSHMPYVEGFGTWPFGEEWLFEAMASSYLPLLDVLPGSGVTVSVTPVLADQLDAPGLGERFTAFLRDVRPASHALDAEEYARRGMRGEARAVELAADDYARALARFERLGAGGLFGALAPAWTSSATHAILPLCATEAGVRLQLRVGTEAHRARSGGGWDGGLWLPECAYAPWLDPLLEQAGARRVCVDLTDVLGRGTPEQLRPLRTEAGPLLVPIDREIIELVWSPGGYPSHAAYRDYHRRSPRDHHPWAVDGAAYDPDRAREQCGRDARHFVARVRERLSGGGLCVCAVDTELLGHWWYEGPWWLADVVAECAAQGVALTPLDEAVAATQAAEALEPERLGATTWGTPRDLSTWDHPGVAELAWRARAAELAVVAAGPHPPPRAVRELLALQSSDWAFLMTNGLAGPYPVERADAHHAALLNALAGPGPTASAALRNLAGLAGPAALALA
jgi:1,4-alpha-glucan branching enzyme